MSTDETVDPTGEFYERGRCDTCGAPCDEDGCTRDRAHTVALDGAEEEYEEPPGPTLGERAQAAQDAIGWSPMPTRGEHDADEFTNGVIELARVVVGLAGEVARLSREVEEAKGFQSAVSDLAGERGTDEALNELVGHDPNDND